MTLTAPDHIRGRLHRWGDPAKRSARIEWVRAMLAKGHRQPEIAEALGISARSLGQFCARHKIPARQPRKRLVLDWGRVSMADFSHAELMELERLALQGRFETVSDYIVDAVRGGLPSA